MHITDIICFIFTIILVYLYQVDKKSLVEIIIFSFGLTSFHLSIGPTLNPFFFFSVYILFLEFNFILKNSIMLNKNKIFFIFLPIISIFIFYIQFIFNNYFEINEEENFDVITNGLYFYIKYYIPLLAIANRLYREYNYKTKLEFYSAIRFVALASSFIAILQLIVHMLIPGSVIETYLGMDIERYNYTFSNINFKRVNAFFYEPKYLAVFLSLSMPILLKEKEYLLVLLVIIVTLFTLSNIFFAIILSIIFTFLSSLLSNRIRVVITLSLILLFGFFNFSKQILIFTYSNNYIKENLVLNLMLNRAVQRYNADNVNSATIFLGLPLQGDLEGPILNFFKDHLEYVITGYGPGNGNFVPNRYYINTTAYKDRVKDKINTHVDMGWFYWVFELGIIISMIYFFLITNVSIKNRFDIYYYSLLIISLMFFRIEILVITGVISLRSK